MRQDLKLRQKAKDRWEESLHVMDRETKIPNFPLAFKKNDKWIWFCSKGWACAELRPINYENHRYYKSLEEALNKES